MKVVLQRVSAASVSVEGREVARIGRGHLLLVGIRDGDDEESLTWMARKVVDLRVFPDGEGRMNLDLADVGGDLLVVSQFTLYGDARKGRRPSFVDAAPPDVARPLFDRFVELVAERAPAAVEVGRFGALMDVSLVNDGPVTMILER